MSTSILVKSSALTAGVVSLIGATVCVCDPSYAQVINGGFETGTFAGFERIGVTSIQTAAFGSGPTEGNFQALITNAEGSVSTPNLETFLGLTPGSLQNRGANGGSAIRQTFTADAGNVLTFNFNFLTNETAPPALNDIPFVTLNSSVTELTNAFSASFPSFTPLTNFEAETGFQSFSLTVPTTGTFTLGFGVTDIGDPIVDSGLLVENIVLQPIPEPSSIFGFLTFSAFIAAAMMKHKQRRI